VTDCRNTLLPKTLNLKLVKKEEFQLRLTELSASILQAELDNQTCNNSSVNNNDLKKGTNMYIVKLSVCVCMYMSYTQGVTGGTDQTSGGCSLC